MNDPDLFFLHALLCGEQGRRPVFPAKEAAERAFAPRPWEEIVELFQRPRPRALQTGRNVRNPSEFWLVEAVETPLLLNIRAPWTQKPPCVEHGGSGC